MPCNIVIKIEGVRADERILEYCYNIKFRLLQAGLIRYNSLYNRKLSTIYESSKLPLGTFVLLAIVQDLYSLIKPNTKNTPIMIDK